MIDLAEQALEVLGVRADDRLADPAEPQRAQRVALARARAAGRAAPA